MIFLCYKKKTAYEMRISDWSSDVCSSDLVSTTSTDVDSKVLDPGMASSERSASSISQWTVTATSPPAPKLDVSTSTCRGRQVTDLSARVASAAATASCWAAPAERSMDEPRAASREALVTPPVDRESGVWGESV